LKIVTWNSKSGGTEGEIKKDMIINHVQEVDPDIFSFPSNTTIALKGYESVTDLQANASIYFKKDRLKNISKKLSEKGIYSLFQVKGSKMKFIFCENIGGHL
jgi:hypothetical protein